MASDSNRELTYAQQRASDAMDRAAGELVSVMRQALGANRVSAAGVVVMVGQAVGMAKAAMLAD